ncbi:MAG TPA: hypothetical protein VMH89_06225 [Candidatus Acidoferrum sp.]|nr:hypothetical protein [Candidatus Acidoferrum sp.]
MWGWIVCNKDAIQAVIGIVTALLTLALVIVTFIYAWVTYRTFRTIESDLLFRSRPIPSFHIHVSETPRGNNAKSVFFEVKIEALHAPMLLREVAVTFQFVGSQESEKIVFPQKRRRPIAVNGEAKFSKAFHVTRNVEIPVTDVRYSDLGDNFIFRSRYVGDVHRFTNKRRRQTPFALLKSGIRFMKEKIEEMEDT